MGLGGSDPQAEAASANQRGSRWEARAAGSTGWGGGASRWLGPQPELPPHHQYGSPASLPVRSEPSAALACDSLVWSGRVHGCQGGSVSEHQDLGLRLVASPLQRLPRNSLQMVKYSESLKITPDAKTD